MPAIARSRCFSVFIVVPQFTLMLRAYSPSRKCERPKVPRQRRAWAADDPPHACRSGKHAKARESQLKLREQSKAGLVIACQQFVSFADGSTARTEVYCRSSYLSQRGSPRFTR
jgi:hypothetical protein